MNRIFFMLFWLLFKIFGIETFVQIRVLTSDICNRSFEDRGVIDMRSQYVDGGRNCKLAIESNSQHPNRDESFDNSDLQFSKQLASRPITVTYIEKIAIADSDSYLSEGMCSLAN